MQSSPKKDPRHRPQKPGFFITFEGIEGCGKTTQCHRLAIGLRKEGFQVVETREPGGTFFAERIRSLFLKNAKGKGMSESLTPQCETALVLASRSQHITHTIVPALFEGHIVLCDRFSDSTLAYQGYGRGLDLHTLLAFNQFVTGGLTPALTFLFDLPVQQGLARRKGSGTSNRLDRERRAFHERVRQGFLHLAGINSDRMIVLNGRQSPEIIASQVAHQTLMMLQ